MICDHVTERVKMKYFCCLVDECVEGHVERNPCDENCQHPLTCMDASTTTVECVMSEDCEDQCLCPYGMYESISGDCVTIDKCECLHLDNTYPAGYISVDDENCRVWWVMSWHNCHLWNLYWQQKNTYCITKSLFTLPSLHSSPLAGNPKKMLGKWSTKNELNFNLSQVKEVPVFFYSFSSLPNTLPLIGWQGWWYGEHEVLPLRQYQVIEDLST